MSAWTKAELAKIGSADELQIASLRSDGTLGKPVTIWSVVYDGNLFVRSVNGPTAWWFRATHATHRGRVLTRDVERDVAFGEADGAIADELGELSR